MRTALFVICFFLHFILCLLTVQFDLENFPFVVVRWLGNFGVGIAGIMLFLDWDKKKNE